ncbi:MAG: long-chain fatty acid--CoA ligase [Paraburkholderia fungorum]|nr:long-chain fatty acid--CoA ligase [Paraburkholderia fungorum]
MYITQTLRRAVQINAKATATICAGRRQTWMQFQERIARLGAALRTLGVDSGDRVAILSLNSDRYIEYFYAVAWIGAASNPVNIRLTAPEIAYTLEDSGTAVLLVDDAFAAMLPSLRKLSGSVKHYIHMGDAAIPEGCLSYEVLIKQNAPVEDVGAGGGALAGLFYTGGTTGKSKGVMLTHNNVVFNALNVIPALGYDDRAVYLHAAPMFHLADMANTFALTAAGGTHVVVPRFDVDVVLAEIARERVTHTVLVPTMINLLVNSGKIKQYDLSSLQRMLYGASPMPEAVMLRAMEALPGVGFAQGYGQTEAAPVITFLEPRFHVRSGAKLTSAGRPAYGVEVLVLDEDDREVPRGTVGEICARGLNVMQGYWGLEELSAKTLRNGWLHTGDLGYMDEDGFVYLVDRAKDMIISGGENIFSIEVEGAIYQHSAVQECAVVGIPSEEWGEEVLAIVVPKTGASVTGEEIIGHCRTLIAGYKLPRRIEIRAEPLPVSGAGKILKVDLRKPYWEGRTKRVN